MKKLSYEKKVKLKKAIFVNSKLIVVAAIGAIIGSLSVGYAAQIYYDGVNVGYDNTASGLTSTTVQGALDELCNVADLSDRVSSLEGSLQVNVTENINTTNTGKGSSASVIWAKKGKIVIVNIGYVYPKQSGHYVLASGLPKAEYTTSTMISNNNITYPVGIVDGSTTLDWWWATSGSTPAMGQLIYISSE